MRGERQAEANHRGPLKLGLEFVLVTMRSYWRLFFFSLNNGFTVFIKFLCSPNWKLN